MLLLKFKKGSHVQRKAGSNGRDRDHSSGTNTFAVLHVSMDSRTAALQHWWRSPSRSYLCCPAVRFEIAGHALHLLGNRCCALGRARSWTVVPSPLTLAWTLKLHWSDIEMALTMTNDIEMALTMTLKWHWRWHWSGIDDDNDIDIDNDIKMALINPRFEKRV